MKILLQHIKTDTSELRDKFIKHCVPLPVESIILRCLEKHPDDRYQTVEALRIDIEKARQGTRLTPVPNRKLITFQRRLKSINPGKALAVCLSIGAVYFLATVSIAVLTSNREHPPDWKTLDSQGQDQFNRGELSLAKATFERALSSARASNNDHRLVLASLEELLDLSRAEENLSDSAALVKEIAKLNVEQDKKADGLERELKTELSKPSIKDPQRLTSLFNNANDLAASLIEMAHYKKARSILELGKELCAKTLGPNCKPMTRFEHNLAYELHSEGRYTEAYDQYLKTLALERQVFKDGSNSLQSITLLDYGRLCMQIGKDAAVESTFQKCLELDKVLFGPQSPQVAWVRFNLAALYYRQGRNDDTRRELNTALAIYNSLDESQPGKEARCYLLLGLVNKDTDCLRKALALYQSATKKDYAFLLETLEGIGQQAENTEPKVAIPFVARALALSERLGEKDKDMEKSKLLSVLGRLYRKVSDLPNAEKAWARALYNRKKQFGDTSWPVFETLSDLAILNNDCGRSERAEEYFQNCFKILSLRRDNAYSPKVIRKTLFWYAQMHKTEEPSRISEAIPQRWRHLMPQHVKLGNALSPPVKPKSSARI